MNSILIIAGRVIASPLVNVFQKKLTNREISAELIVSFSYLFFVVLSIPVFIVLKPFDLAGEFWFYISLVGVFDIFGNMFLVKSLSTIELSVFGPLNSYKPIFAIVFSAIFLGEIPTFWGVLGVIIIISGSYVLNFKPGVGAYSIRSFLKNRGILFRFLAIALTAIAAVFSKKAILLSSPIITLAYWALIGWPISIIMVNRLKSNWKLQVGQLKKYSGYFGLLFLSFFALQFFTLLAFQQIFVGYSLALFQLSSLISVIFGVVFFKEQNVALRLVGSAIMVVGAILIAVFG